MLDLELEAAQHRPWLAASELRHPDILENVFTSTLPVPLPFHPT